MKNKNILITGAGGYLGGYLGKAIVSRKDIGLLIRLNLNKEADRGGKTNNFKVKNYYLCDNTVEEIFEENKIDAIIHTAVLYGRRQEQLVDMINANVAFPLEVLSLAIKYGVKTFINTDTILAKNLNPYSITKSQFADWLSFYSNDIKVINMRLDHFYGPNDKPVKFIAWLIEQFKNKVPKIDLTEGSQTRDFIYIDDVVNAFMCVLENEDKILPGRKNDFEVGTGHNVSVKYLVTTLKKIMNNTETELNFGAIPYRKNEVLTYDVDTSGLCVLGWKSKVVLEEGLKKIIEIEGIK